MRIRSAAWTGVLLLLYCACSSESRRPDNAAMNEREKVSYSFGYEVGRSMRINSADIDPDIFSEAFREGLAGEEAIMSDQEMSKARLPLERQMNANRAEQVKQANLARMQLAQTQKGEGEAFLAENARKEGVTTLPSGLQYRIIKKGEGRRPAGKDSMQIHYRGSLIDGTEFINSYESGKPISIRIDQVIPGWQEALPLMAEGSKWRLFIPQNLAYGSSGADRDGKTFIPPYASLICDIELMSVGKDSINGEESLQILKAH